MKIFKNLCSDAACPSVILREAKDEGGSDNQYIIKNLCSDAVLLYQSQRPKYHRR